MITIYLNRPNVGLDTLDILNNYMDIREIDLDEMVHQCHQSRGDA